MSTPHARFLTLMGGTSLEARIEQLEQERRGHSRLCPMAREDSVLSDASSLAAPEQTICFTSIADDVDMHEEQSTLGLSARFGQTRSITLDSVSHKPVSLPPSPTQCPSTPQLPDMEDDHLMAGPSSMPMATTYVEGCMLYL
jgi:hypothetical protein